MAEVEAGYRALTAQEQAVCAELISEAEIMIDACSASASSERKKLVTLRMVRRAIASISADSVPMGATQGSMTAGPYTQSWTLGSGSGAGELYLSRLDKNILGMGNRIGSYSPLEGMAVEQHDPWN